MWAISWHEKHDGATRYADVASSYEAAELVAALAKLGFEAHSWPVDSTGIVETLAVLSTGKTPVTIQASTRMMKVSEVAKRLGVDPKTVTRWARAGKIHHVVTPNGHRRFPEAHINKILNGGQ